MPEALALIPLILTGVGTAVGLKESLSGGGAPKTAAPTLAQTTPAATQTKQNQEVAASQQFPNFQATSGGALQPDMWVQMSKLISGEAGTPGISGIDADLLRKIMSGNTNVTAGSANNPQPGQPGLSNTVFA